MMKTYRLLSTFAVRAVRGETEVHLRRLTVLALLLEGGLFTPAE